MTTHTVWRRGGGCGDGGGGVVGSWHELHFHISHAQKAPKLHKSKARVTVWRSAPSHVLVMVLFIVEI